MIELKTAGRLWWVERTGSDRLVWEEDIAWFWGQVAQTALVAKWVEFDPKLHEMQLDPDGIVTFRTPIA